MGWLPARAVFPPTEHLQAAFRASGRNLVVQPRGDFPTVAQLCLTTQPVPPHCMGLGLCGRGCVAVILGEKASPMMTATPQTPSCGNIQCPAPWLGGVERTPVGTGRASGDLTSRCPAPKSLQHSLTLEGALYTAESAAAEINLDDNPPGSRSGESVSVAKRRQLWRSEAPLSSGMPSVPSAASDPQLHPKICYLLNKGRSLSRNSHLIGWSYDLPRESSCFQLNAEHFCQRICPLGEFGVIAVKAGIVLIVLLLFTCSFFVITSQVVCPWP